ncbi:MAG: flagellar basal body L-ring protein FlgH [Geminicoccaceae bacterium]|nr:flagellar basal body L-ring protein FlgH [Geminicoccaceae bacterium]
MNLSRFVLSVLVSLFMVTATGCNTIDRLSNIGKAPELRPIEDPRAEPDYRPVSLPMPAPDPSVSAGANSLWREGARGFFRDQRARRIGDILTVSVTIADKANLSNETSRSRTNSDDLGLTNILGFETKLTQVLPDGARPDAMVSAESDMSNRGIGEVARSEDIDVNIAAIITQVLPNGNLVVQGSQEIRVNFEVREVMIAGIVRPEDVTPQNTISHEKIAELRVAYGGRGQITDVQQPRYGAQMLDVILPY